MASGRVEGKLLIAIGEVEARKECRFGLPNFLDALVNGANGVLVRKGFEIEKAVVQHDTEAGAVFFGNTEDGGIMARI